MTYRSIYTLEVIKINPSGSTNPVDKNPHKSRQNQWHSAAFINFMSPKFLDSQTQINRHSIQTTDRQSCMVFSPHTMPKHENQTM
jgi:hypothetical protein